MDTSEGENDRHVAAGAFTEPSLTEAVETLCP